MAFKKIFLVSHLDPLTIIKLQPLGDMKNQDNQDIDTYFYS